MMMSNWNGTILGPPHVCLPPSFAHRVSCAPMYIANTPGVERPREPDLQCKHPLRARLSRQPSYHSVRLARQHSLCRSANWKGTGRIDTGGTGQDPKSVYHAGGSEQSSVSGSVEATIHDGDCLD